MKDNSVHQNDIYIFMPWGIPEGSSLESVRTQLEGDPAWKLFPDTCRYLYRYVGQKFAQTDKKGRPLPVPPALYCHYRRTDFRGLPLLPDDGLLEAAYQQGKDPIRIKLRLHEAHLFAYQTGIGIIALRFSVDARDYLDVADAEFILKKTGNSTLRLPGEKNGWFSPLEAARELLRAPLGVIPEKIDFLSLTNDVQWADVAAYVRVPSRGEDASAGDYSRELYYLRNCYSRYYRYSTHTFQEADDCYCSNPSAFWGLSSDGIVLLHALEEEEPKGFEKTFYNNFHSDYLFLIVYMLHEKYVLHRFMSDLDARTGTDLDKLKKYKADLVFFNINYVYTSVSNVQQYRILHEKLRDVMLLRRLYQDVNEPLTTLQDLLTREEENRRRREEEAEQKQQARMEKLLNRLALLSIFSALTDAFAFILQIRDLPSLPVYIWLPQLACVVIVFCVAMPLLREWWKNRRDQQL